MSAQSIQAIIGLALTDTKFREGLLNGSRRRMLQAFPLSGEEIEAIMAIRSESLEQFAGELHKFLLRSEAVHELDPLPFMHVKLVQNLNRTPIPPGTPAE